MLDDEHAVDIGHDVRIQFTSWRDHGRCGLIEDHLRPDGTVCGGGVLFDLPGVREAFPGRPLWTVEQWEPLTLSPSLLCTDCGHHGFIRDGRWVTA